MDHQMIFAKDAKDIPEWMRAHHEWEAALDVKKLPELHLKVKMCCVKCEEIVVEAIREVPGVFDVRVDRGADRVYVVASTREGPDSVEVVRKAKKVDQKAKIVATPPPPPQPKAPATPKEPNQPKEPTTSVQWVTSPLIWGYYEVPRGPYAHPSQNYPPRPAYNPNYPSKETSYVPYYYNYGY
jgi:hypothetical protein